MRKSIKFTVKLICLIGTTDRTKLQAVLSEFLEALDTTHADALREVLLKQPITLSVEDVEYHGFAKDTLDNEE